MKQLKNWIVLAVMVSLLITAWAIGRKPVKMVKKPVAVCGKRK